MANSARDENRVTTIIGVSSADGTTPVIPYVDPVTHRLLTSAAGSTTPGGSDTQVQFNDASSMGGDAGFTYNKTTDTATLVGDIKSARALVADTDASNYLAIKAGSNLTADRILTVTTGDAARTLTISADATVSQDYSTTGNPQFATIELGAATDTTISRASAGVIAVEGVNVVTVSATQTLTNKTLTSPIISTISNTGTVTLPTATDTLVGRTTTDTLTNKTLTTPTITKPVMDATNPSAQTYSPAAAATATLDLSLANEHRITMPAGNITIALSNDTNAQKFIVSITQDATGSRTVNWFTTIRWAGGSTPTLTTTASKRDTFGFIRTGSGTYDGFVIGQNI